MCFERKVSEVKDGRHVENGELAVIKKADGSTAAAENGFYFGNDDNSLVGPFPSYLSANTQHRAAFAPA